MLNVRSILIAGLAITVCRPLGAMQQSSGGLEIHVLSSRPELVTGGDALVKISLPAAADSVTTRVTVDGRDVTTAFRVDVPRALVGLVGGLRSGRQTIRAVSGGASAELIVTNHPLDGPVLSGPHLKPLVCATTEAGLGPPLDANCSAATKVEYVYKPRMGGMFKPLAGLITERPSDLDTTTREGRTVPYIVRVESGTSNRGIFRIAMLDDPADATTFAWRPGPSWNGRLVVQFGGGTGTKYTQGAMPTSEQVASAGDQFLSRGFAFVISTHTLPFVHSNDSLAGEALMMLKEHFIERYGVPAWTLGAAASSGTMYGQLIAQNFPGLLDGLLLDSAYPDQVTVWSDVTDCRLLRTYFATHQGWTAEQQQAVEGSAALTCAAWAPYANAVVAANTEACGIASELVYDPVRNPKGARCTIFDTNVNTYGRDPVTGGARRTLDNVGVEYGRQALSNRLITPGQFVELNQRIGGYDNDGNLRAARTAANLDAVRLAYAAGRVNSGGGSLAWVPIIQFRRYTDRRGDIHDRARDLAIRDRLLRANGHANNQVIWITAGSTAALAVAALDTMTEWLQGIVSDTSADTPEIKMRRAKPPLAVDACWDQDTRIDEPLAQTLAGPCTVLYPTHANPRLAAGGPISGLALKCELKRLRRADYPGVAFDAAQWRELNAIFTDGVCDYSKPGVGQGPIARTYLALPLAGAMSRPR